MSELSIVTTQNVTINFETATVVERVMAYIIDVLVFVAYYALYQLVYAVFDLEVYYATMERGSVSAIEGIIYLPVLFYALWQESLFDGQTVGKKILKIKVIKIDGYEAGFGDYLIRWVFRIVEVTTIMGIIGLITMVVNKKTQRLGDMVAGTAVITLKNDVSINQTILQELADDYVPTYPLVIKLTDDDVRIIKDTYESSIRAADFEMLNKLMKKIEQVTGIKPTTESATVFVGTVLKDYNYYTRKM